MWWALGFFAALRLARLLRSVTRSLSLSRCLGLRLRQLWVVEQGIDLFQRAGDQILTARMLGFCRGGKELKQVFGLGCYFQQRRGRAGMQAHFKIVLPNANGSLIGFHFLQSMGVSGLMQRCFVCSR